MTIAGLYFLMAAIRSMETGGITFWPLAAWAGSIIMILTGCFFWGLFLAYLFWRITHGHHHRAHH